MTQKADPVQWLLPPDAVLLPALEKLVENAAKAHSRLGFFQKNDDLAALIRQVKEDLSLPELLGKQLAVRSFFEPANKEVRSSLVQLASYLPTLLCEYSDFFSALSHSSRGTRAASLIEPGFVEGARQVVAGYKKEILADLLNEKDLIAGHLRRLDEMSLSCGRPGEVKGEARRMLQSLSRERRMMAYRSLAGRMGRYRNEAEKEFVQLHESRRSMAGQAGFKTYFDYALARSGLTEEGRASVTVFRQLVQEYLAPLGPQIRANQWKRLGIADPKPWDVMCTAPFGLPLLDSAAYPLEKTYLQALRYLFTARVPLFESMLEAGALSFHVTGEPREETAPFDSCVRETQEGVVSAYFPDLDRSCLLLSHLPQEWLAGTVFAETGSLLLEQSAGHELPCPLRSAEAGMIANVARYSMSFLSQRTWTLFYGKMARYAREYDLTSLALDLPLYCALDEMEEFLSRARITNPEVFRHAWSEIARRYLLAGTARHLPTLIPVDDLWLYSPTLWSRPLSGIYQALAAVTVLGTLPFGRHHQVLETCFAQLLNNREVTGSFARLADAGYPSPYEEETMLRARFAMVDYLGL